MTSIMLAMPAYGGSIKLRTVQSLLKLQNDFGGKGISIGYAFRENAEITLTRNYFGSLAANRNNRPHVLMIDHDMAFEPITIFKLLAADKDVVGAVCPQRKMTPQFNFKSDQPPEINSNGLAKVRAIGAGIVLIKTQVFLDLIATGELSECASPMAGFDAPLYGFFDRWVDGKNYHSEDLSFCERWRALCGGEVWALFGEKIGHVGDYEFSFDVKLGEL